MKAILIDPTKREVRGIEVEPTQINGAFSGGANTKMLILSAMIGWNKIMYFDGYAQPREKPFWFQGLSQAVHGKGLLLGRVKGQWPTATELTVREVECLVRFGS